MNFEKVYSLDSFILEKTIDINCKNENGLTALQIVTKSILAGENNDKRTDDIKKLGLLLYSDADAKAISNHDITLLLNLVRSDYPEKEKLISLLRRHTSS